ncbi:methylenetetrahydrofolate reductase [NAD(P)H] [Cochlodiniinecator piscidefendens]|uniref:methylenetetrahydrofolate reductase [NAD(P)H] n=1 Tax=Cochlodiniinecator piscidefendens TaxID=2715756 RepID=UPI00140D1A2D|nr:methylenetetrahydrofolate reductase [NAD(P)H] [Cochlodiniinecator piscidefendens]
MTTPNVSFEFFPPQSLNASFRLWETVQSLAPLAPEFVSVTYGAGGTTRKLTHDAVKTISDNTDLKVAAHLTCVDATRAETLSIARDYANIGIKHIVALRGDAPKESKRFVPHPDGFADCCALIEGLSSVADFNIKVGAYPESHPDAENSRQNVEWLKRKIDAGASTAITQFFFDPEVFFRFRDDCAKAGINAPIIPGILPIENWAGVQKFAARCGATLPSWLIDAFTKATRDGHEDLLATAIAAELCSDLMDGGVEDLHFYTLNRPTLTRDVCRAIGVEPNVTIEMVA